jgi:HlyD family secretion protein
MATVADMSKIIFKMNVDELDISKVKEGQKVTVTADAMPEKTYSGYIDYINQIGTSSNGVTSYPVTVVVEEAEGLMPGMNVSAKVIVERVEEVIRIPVSALRRGNMVMVKLKDGEKAPEPRTPNGQQGQGGQPQTGGQSQAAGGQMRGVTAPEGFKVVTVQTGLNDSDYIEIKSGISAGDEVQITSSASTTNRTVVPQMGGAAPGGGMPAGGGGGVQYRGGGGGGATFQRGG